MADPKYLLRFLLRLLISYLFLGPPPPPPLISSLLSSCDANDQLSLVINVAKLRDSYGKSFTAEFLR